MSVYLLFLIIFPWVLFGAAAGWLLAAPTRKPSPLVPPLPSPPPEFGQWPVDVVGLDIYYHGEPK